MSMEDEGASGRKPLVVGIGGVGCRTASDLDPGGFDVACIDTDIRTALRIDDVRIIGRSMVQGEGCGGNMSLGKAVFRRSLDTLREIIADHSPVITICSMGGGTGIPGAVEMNQLLRSSLIPCFNIIILEDMGNGAHFRSLTNVFLSGPLCPGASVILTPSNDTRHEDAPPSSMKMVKTAVSLAARASSQTADIMVPEAVWHIFGREMRPFSLSLMDLPSADDMNGVGLSDLKGTEGQTLMILEIPANTSNSETDRIMDSIGGRSPDAHIGLVEDPGRKAGFTVLSIRLSTEKPGIIDDRNLTHITREYVEELLSDGYGMTLDRSGPLL
ncbi:MAG: hypothetical protein ACMUIG_01975 [Thermoplasmatota archaeon]